MVFGRSGFDLNSIFESSGGGDGLSNRCDI